MRRRMGESPRWRDAWTRGPGRCVAGNARQGARLHRGETERGLRELSPAACARAVAGSGHAGPKRPGRGRISATGVRQAILAVNKMDLGYAQSAFKGSAKIRGVKVADIDG